MKLLLLLASAAIASNICDAPIVCSGNEISHSNRDGSLHVPATFGQMPGSCLLTEGASGDAFWGTCPGASGGIDSAQASALIGDSLAANAHGWQTAAQVDIIVHDTANVLRSSLGGGAIYSSSTPITVNTSRGTGQPISQAASASPCSDARVGAQDLSHATSKAQLHHFLLTIELLHVPDAEAIDADEFCTTAHTCVASRRRQERGGDVS